jgi:hypothetical protein
MANAYDQTLDPDYPPDSKFESSEEESAFKAKGRDLASRLQKELGASYAVVSHRKVGE